MRADRLISILLHLQHAGRMTARQLAEVLEVSERTIYRDIDALSGMGIPVQAEAGTGGGFALPANYRPKVDGLNTQEIHALFLQMNEQPFKQLGIDQSMRTALLKLLGSLPDRQREDADWIRDRVFIDTGSWRRQPEREGQLPLIRRAVWEQRRARITYTDKMNATSVMTLDSYGIVLKSGMWFVIGFAAEAVRALRAAKIQTIELTEETFVRPDDFRLETFWAEWVAKYEHRQFPYRVEARIGEEALTRISKFGGVLFRTWGEEEERERRAEIGFEDEDAAWRAMLALSDLARVESPPALGELVREKAGRLINRDESAALDNERAED